MNIPNYENIQFTERTGYLTEQWQINMQQLISALQKNVGNEGFVISSVSSDPASVTPTTVGGQLAQLQASFGQQTGVQVGTVVFDPYEVNGATLPARNGQLKVMLADGTFHAITNS
jgi:hypothetical protein